MIGSAICKLCAWTHSVLQNENTQNNTLTYTKYHMNLLLLKRLLVTDQSHGHSVTIATTTEQVKFSLRTLTDFRQFLVYFTTNFVKYIAALQQITPGLCYF